MEKSIDGSPGWLENNPRTLGKPPCIISTNKNVTDIHTTETSHIESRICRKIGMKQIVSQNTNDQFPCHSKDKICNVLCENTNADWQTSKRSNIGEISHHCDKFMGSERSERSKSQMSEKTSGSERTRKNGKSKKCIESQLRDNSGGRRQCHGGPLSNAEYPTRKGPPISGRAQKISHGQSNAKVQIRNGTLADDRSQLNERDRSFGCNRMNSNNYDKDPKFETQFDERSIRNKRYRLQDQFARSTDCERSQRSEISHNDRSNGMGEGIHNSYEGFENEMKYNAAHSGHGGNYRSMDRKCYGGDQSAVGYSVVGCNENPLGNNTNYGSDKLQRADYHHYPTHVLVDNKPRDQRRGYIRESYLMDGIPQRPDTAEDSDKTEVRWLCIPGEIPWIEQHAVVLASPSEVRRARNQLFCRPAAGFGQNWFHVKLTNVPPMPTDSSENSYSQIQEISHSTHKTKPKTRRRNKNCPQNITGGKKNSTNDSPKKRSYNASPRSNSYKKRTAPKLMQLNNNASNLNTHVKGQTISELIQGNVTILSPCSLYNQRFPVSTIYRIPNHVNVQEIGARLCDRECNNSNETNLHAHGSAEQNGRINGIIIRVQGDGRCLFRSLVTCLSPYLQKVRRDDFGTPVTTREAQYETEMADNLRAMAVRLMIDNAHFYSQLERIVINADQPMSPGYNHFQDRLTDMTLSSTMPGDLELNATSTALERQVWVLDVNLTPIFVYGRDRFPENTALAVRFTKLGHDVGHYDAFIPDEDYNNCFHGNGRGNTHESDVKQDNLMSKETIMFDYFEKILAEVKKQLSDNKDRSRSCLCHEKRRLKSAWRNESKNSDEQKEDFDNCATMNWSPTHSCNDNINENKTDRKLCNDLEQNTDRNKENIKSDSYMKAKCNEIVLDLLVENVKCVNKKTKRNGNKQGKGNDNTGHATVSELNQVCEPTEGNSSSGGEVDFEEGCSKQPLRFGNSTWKTCQQASRAVIKRQSGLTQGYCGKCCRKSKDKKHTYKRRVRNKKQKRSTKPKVGKFKRIKRSSKNMPRLVRQKVVVARYRNKVVGSSKKNRRDASKKKDEAIIIFGEPDPLGPRCEKPKGVSPPKPRLVPPRDKCLVCHMPVIPLQRRKQCTLCNRVAHQKCVPASLQGSDVLFFVCPTCVHV